MPRRKCLCFLLFLVLAPYAFAQTGVYPFGSYDTKGFDSINLGNLNTHFEIPIVTKSGRGLPFTYTLAYDGLVWSTVTADNGMVSWQPNANWGFSGQLGQEGFQGYVSYRDYQQKCFIDGPSWFWADHQTNFVYHDQYGVDHWINYSYNACTDGNPDSGDGSTSDGSGISWDGSKIHLKNGSTLIVPVNTTTGTGSITDTNGNTITNNGNGTFVDTTGTTELTIAYAGDQNNQRTFNYPVALQADGATKAIATVYYVQYTVSTFFQCQNISEYGATSVNLVDHITLADSPADTYKFTYEPTPDGSGNVTGRIASITLPSGGTITYKYSGGCGNGINTDGTPAKLVRATSDGQKSYTRDISQAPVTTTVVSDEQGNETDLNFISDTTGHVYETSRSVYQGTTQSGGILLESKTTTYNAQDPSTQLTSQITETDVTDKFNGVKPVETVTNYDYGGMPTSVAVQDPSNGNAGLLATETTYNSYEEITLTQTLDSAHANATVTYATYGYDESTPSATSGIPQHSGPSGARGNQTSAHISTGSGTIDTSTSYFDTGAVASTTAPTGTTQYSLDPTQTFVTQTTLPTPSSGVQISTSAAYDTASGVQTSATGANAGQTITYAQYDRLLRPTQITTPAPDNGLITYSYTPTETTVVTKMNASQSADQETFLDGYGRTKRVAVANGSGWYLTDSCYDAAGHLQFQSVPYYSATDNPASMNCSASTAVQYSYDALGRQTQINRPDGSSVTYTYNGRATKSVSSPGTSRITQYDLLGRISSVCELTSTALAGGSGSPVDCASDIAGTGYLTTYTYNLSTHTTTVAQGAQQRTFQTDAIGRTASTVEPEAGTTNYSYTYNSTGLLVTRTRPRANQTNTGTVTTTQTQYDTLGRIVSVTYDDGTPAKTFSYDTGVISGATSYAAGQLTVASTTSGSTTITQHQYGYDIMGRVSQTVDCVPNTCGSYNATRWYGYNSASQLTTETYASAVNGGSPVSLTYGYNLAGQLTSMTGGQNNATNAPNIFTVTAVGPSGPTLAQFGNGVYSPYQYDTMGRISTDSICSGSSQPNCPGGTMLYGYSTNWSGSRLTSMCDFVLYQCANTGYDDLGRLNAFTVTSGNANSFSYSYDRWGNRLTQTVTQGSGPQPSLSFNAANQITNPGYQYDAAGNAINDGIHTYSYDAENNLTAIDGGSTASYAYDALNERVQVSTAAGTELYDFDLNGRRATTWSLSSTSITAAQYYAGASRVAYWTASDNNIHFEHQDWLGTERARTNPTGAVEGSYTSLPFGDNAQVSGSDTNAGHFAMLDQDVSASAGLSHATFREYSSTAGRWASPDPYLASYDAGDPQSMNRYAYVENLPLRLTDSLGLDYIDGLGNLCSTTTQITMTGGQPSNGSAGVAVGTQQTMCTPIFSSPQGTSIPWYISEYGGPVCGNMNGSVWPCPSLQTTSTSTSSLIPTPTPSNLKNRIVTWIHNHVCGGTFNYVGVEADGAVGGMFTGGIAEHDSVDGDSHGSLVEGWLGGEGPVIGAGKITTGNDTSLFNGLLSFVGMGASEGPLAGVQGGVVGGNGWLGGYGEGHIGPVAWGGGAYLRSSCKAGG